MNGPSPENMMEPIISQWVRVHGPLTVQVTPGQNLALFGSAEDPDGDDLSINGDNST